MIARRTGVMPRAKDDTRSIRRWRAGHGLCVMCGGTRENARFTRCNKCRAINTKTARTRRERLKREGLCVWCGIEKADGGRVHCARCADRMHEQHRERTRRLKDQVYAAYGGKRCVCCGETEERFLTIDHVNNDGNRHRKEVGAGKDMYGWLIRNGFPSGFQVLCQNCNMGKYLNGGVCPHQTAFQSSVRDHCRSAKNVAVA